MKKQILLVVFCSIFVHTLFAQSIGFSASLLGYSPRYMPQVYTYYNKNRELGSASMITPGIRTEFNFISQGGSFPAVGYAGLGFSYFAPSLDSAVIDGTLQNGAVIENILGTRKVSGTVIGLRIGYEINQNFNDFLMIHAGIGMGFARFKSVNIVPERSNTFPFDESDFKSVTFTPVIQANPFLEPLIGVSYEFEKFSLLAQYSVIVPMGGNYGKIVRMSHGASAGIYIPIKRF